MHAHTHTHTDTHTHSQTHSHTNRYTETDTLTHRHIRHSHTHIHVGYLIICVCQKIETHPFRELKQQKLKWFVSHWVYVLMQKTEQANCVCVCVCVCVRERERERKSSQEHWGPWWRHPVAIAAQTWGSGPSPSRLPQCQGDREQPHVAADIGNSPGVARLLSHPACGPSSPEGDGRCPALCYRFCFQARGLLCCRREKVRYITSKRSPMMMKDGPAGEGVGGKTRLVCLPRDGKVHLRNQ